MNFIAYKTPLFNNKGYLFKMRFSRKELIKTFAKFIEDFKLKMGLQCTFLNSFATFYRR